MEDPLENKHQTQSCKKSRGDGCHTHTRLCGNTARRVVQSTELRTFEKKRSKGGEKPPNQQTSRDQQR